MQFGKFKNELNKRKWENSSQPFCLKPSDPKTETGHLSKKFLIIGQMMVYEWLLLDLPEL